MADDANPTAKLAELATRELRDITDEDIDAFRKNDLTHLCNCWGVKYNANSSVHTLRTKFRQFRDEWFDLEDNVSPPDITPPPSPTSGGEETPAPNASLSPTPSMGSRTFDAAWNEAAAAAEATAAPQGTPPGLVYTNPPPASNPTPEGSANSSPPPQSDDGVEETKEDLTGDGGAPSGSIFPPHFASEDGSHGGGDFSFDVSAAIRDGWVL